MKAQSNKRLQPDSRNGRPSAFLLHLQLNSSACHALFA